jgi:uncharacterized protein YjlB
MLSATLDESSVPDHPQYAMWKARYDAEQAVARERAAWRAQRDAEQEGWREAWRSYQARWHAGHRRTGTPPWWNLVAWARLLIQASRRYR